MSPISEIEVKIKRVIKRKRRPKKNIRPRQYVHQVYVVHALKRCCWKDQNNLCNGCAFLEWVEHPYGGTRFFCDLHRLPRYTKLNELGSIQLTKDVRGEIFE